MSLKEIVNVSISRETKSVSRAGFGTILILGPNGNFTGQTQEFTAVDSSMAAMLVGGSGAPEYKAAQAIFSQNPSVVKIKIGQILGTRSLTDNAGTWSAGGSISCKVNGVLVTQNFSTDKATTLTAFAVKLAAADGVATATYTDGTHIILITPDAGVPLAITEITLAGTTGTLVAPILSATATASFTDSLDAIVESDDDWYGLCIVSRTIANQEDVAEWTETKRKIFAIASADADIVDTTDSGDTTTIAAIIKANAYTRSFVVALSSAGTEYPDAATLGKLLPYDPGTYTMKFKTLAGITVDYLTATQSTNARDKHANTYEEVGAVNILQEGTVGEGEYLDVIIFIDWLQARITEGVYQPLVNNLKIPYTEIGMAAIKGEIEKVLKIGVARGGISDYAQDSDKNQIGGYTVTLPAFEDITTADKAARLLTGVKFTAWLAGAIHAVEIAGVVTL
jgi:hypothetical protein